MADQDNIQNPELEEAVPAPEPVDAELSEQAEAVETVEGAAPEQGEPEETMRWFIIHTYSGFEEKVKESLEGRAGRLVSRTRSARS